MPGKNNRTGRNLIICLGFSITRRAARAIQERVGTKRANFFGNGKCELRISAPQWWDRKCEGRNEKCDFLARESVNSQQLCEFLAWESVNSSPILTRQWWRHFRLSLFLSLSLSVSLSHRAYLTHKIGSAEALPIIIGSAEALPILLLLLLLLCLFILSRKPNRQSVYSKGAY